MLRRYYTRGDAILTILLIIVSLVSISWVRFFSDGGKHVVVEVDGRHALELSLERNVTTSVVGPHGVTVIVVKNGTVHVPRSACPHGYCTRMGPIRHQGEIIVCAPNRVIVSIRGGSDSSSFDGVTQ